ncbi:MAG: TMEM165/GDT1 family protein [Oscillatoriales cyanobacterium SM2_3_0]|nr:TMEM165/GDT1 family protein [Oscillatoriales cyanobacterium SM2_3_0]
MDWQLLGLSFVAIFLSELGDKSQVAAIALSGTSKSPKAIFLGTAAALLLASFLGVIVGESFANFLPARVVKLAAAIGFLILAIRLLWPGPEELQSLDPGDESVTYDPD